MNKSAAACFSDLYALSLDALCAKTKGISTSQAYTFHDVFLGTLFSRNRRQGAPGGLGMSLGRQ